MSEILFVCRASSIRLSSYYANLPELVTRIDTIAMKLLTLTIFEDTTLEPPGLSVKAVFFFIAPL